MTLIETFARTANFSAPTTSGLRAVFAIARQRRELANLDAAALADMGLTHEDAVTESRRSVWDVPAQWRG